MSYTLEKGSKRSQDVIAAEIAPVVHMSDGTEVRKFQRKLLPLSISARHGFPHQAIRALGRGAA